MHSLRIEPISRSAYPFCRGERAASRRSRRSPPEQAIRTRSLPRAIGDRLRQRVILQIVEQSDIFRMPRDVGDLLRKKPRVDGMAHGTDGRDGEVCLKVTVIVPRERGWPRPEAKSAAARLA